LIERLRHELRLFLVALQFLTRVPVPRWAGFQPAWLNASVRHFPLAGACIGLFAALVLALGEWLFTPLVAALLSTGATVWLTGAFHEDGLADTCDALGGAVDRERALEIMKDSRIGTYGAVGLVLALGLKAAVLAALPLGSAVAALVLGHTCSRAAAVALIRWLPYAGNADRAKAKPLARSISASGVAVAFGWVVVVALLLPADEVVVPNQILFGVIAAGAAAVLLARVFQRRLGGITGDTLGATQQLSELMLLLAWLALQRPVMA